MNVVRQNRANPAPAGVGPRVAVVAVTLSLSLLPWFLAADGRPPEQREANQKRLNEMTETERRRLDENVRLYREMPAAERDRLRELHQAIESDPELKAAFDDYQAWANSLSPVDRHDLRQTRDPEARRRLIEKLHRRPPPRDMPDPFPSDRPPNGPPFGQNSNNGRLRMIEKLFGGMSLPFGDRFGSCVPEMETIIRVLEHELPSETHDELNKLDSYSHKVRVLRLTLERHPLGPPGIRIFGSGTTTIDKVFAALPDGPIKQMPVSRNPNPNQFDARSTLLIIVLMRGLMTETQRTLEDHRPRPDILVAFHKKLDEAERTRLDKLNREDRQLELWQLFVKEQVPGIAELQQILATPEVERFVKQLNNGGRPGQGPPDGGEDRRDKKGRFPPLDGSRRPREPELPPPNRPDPKD